MRNAYFRHCAFALLFFCVANAQQRTEELVGLNGTIKRIERNHYRQDALNEPPAKTLVQYFENDRLVTDSVIYHYNKFTLSASYTYENGWLRTVTWKKPDGGVSEKREIKWLDDRTANVRQFDETSTCAFEMVWQYNADGAFTQYSATDNCAPEKRINTKGNHYYNKDKQRVKSVFSDGNSTAITLYEVLERDDHGNPTRVSEHTIRDGKPEDDVRLIATYRYTYADATPEKKPAKTTKATTGKTAPAKPKARSKDPEACVRTKKYSLAQRKAFYPFSHARSIALVSFAAPPGDNELPELSHAEKVVNLNDKQIAALTDLIYNTGYAEPMLVKTQAVACPSRKNAIVFLDQNNEPFEYILLHFGCDEYAYSSERIRDGEYCSEKFSLLKKYFSDLGLEVGAL